MNGDFFVRSVDASTNRGHEYVNSVSADTYMSGWLMAAFGRFLPVVTGCFGLAVGHFLLVQNLAHSAISALRFSRRSERE